MSDEDEEDTPLQEADESKEADPLEEADESKEVETKQGILNKLEDYYYFFNVLFGLIIFLSSFSTFSLY